MQRRLHGVDADHPLVAASLNNLANVLREQGDVTESARLLRESLAMQRRVYGVDADHPDVVVSLGNLSITSRAQGDLSESARLHRESRAMHRRLEAGTAVRRHLTQDGPDAAMSLGELALALFDEGHVAEAFDAGVQCVMLRLRLWHQLR